MIHRKALRLLILVLFVPISTVRGFAAQRWTEPQEEPVAAAGRFFTGVGVLIAVEPKKGRLVVDHEEIKDFMAPMMMGYQVIPGSLLKGFKAGDKIRFTIDAEKRAIVKVEPLTFVGEGTVIMADIRKSQIIVDHKEIPGFMAEKVMGYPVKPAKLLRGLKPGDKIRFTIDADQKAIVGITQIEK